MMKFNILTKNSLDNLEGQVFFRTEFCKKIPEFIFQNSSKKSDSMQLYKENGEKDELEKKYIKSNMFAIALRVREIRIIFIRNLFCFKWIVNYQDLQNNQD